MPGLSVPSASDPQGVRRFVLDLDRRLEPLDRAILVAEWNLNSGRSTQGSGRWQLRRTRLLSDPRLLPWVRAARQEDLPRPIARRLELLERIVLDTYVEQEPSIVRLREELQREIVRFRPRWKGKRVNRAVVSRALREEPRSSVRRRAYYAYEPLHRPLEARFRELVALRNARAKELGFRSLAHLRLGFQGITPEELEGFIDEAVVSVRSRASALRDSLSRKELEGGWYPWDLVYAREKRVRLPDERFPSRTMLPRILRSVGRWGFPTSRMRFRVVFHDLPAGGLTLAPDPPRDVRILVHPRGGWTAYAVMFHEVGHAVQSASIRAPRHLLRWHENVPGFGGFHEGIGGLFERIPRDPGWLEHDAGIPAQLAHEFAEAHRDADLFGAAWLASWILPELNLYLRPDRDPRAVAERFERRVFGYSPHPPRSPVDSFYVEGPLYSANYLLATLFHCQLAASVREELGDPLWPNRRVGPWLTRNWFAPGSYIEWRAHLAEVTGRPFGPRAFSAELRER